MKNFVVLSAILAVMLGPLSAALAQQPKPTGPTTDQQPKSQPTPASQPTDPDFVQGTVDTVTLGNPAVVTLRGIEMMSDRVRALKKEGKLVFDVPAAALRGGPTLRVGQIVTLAGVVRDGKFLIRRVIFEGSK